MRGPLIERLDGSPLGMGFLLSDASFEFVLEIGLVYRGVDRIPAPPLRVIEFPDRVTAESIAWDKYLDAEESGSLHRDQTVAQRVQRSLQDVSAPVDLTYCEVSLFPHPREVAGVSREQFETFHTEMVTRWSGAPPCPTDYALQGWDLTSPRPTFHSAILHTAPDQFVVLAGALNENGLVQSLDQARMLLRDVNTNPHIDPYCAIALHSRPPSQT